MRRSTFSSIVFIWVLALAQCLPSASSCAYAQATGVFEQGLLWRIEKDGAAPSHLFGTIHLADKRVTTLPDTVRTPFDTARSFAMEVSLDQSNIAALAARMVYLDGRSLPGVAGDALFQKIVLLTAGLGVPAEMARLFKPWAMVLLLQMPQQDPANVLDFMLHRMA
ncbi:MAG TPA: TraB/GumN family protein, partial [Burkholderiales bacterium]|nr:TraB/GumN family protein [Burkholderiales bacterium]